MAERLPALAVGPIARPRRVRFRMTPLARREARWGLFFLSPWIIGFVGFTFLPMIATAVLTLFNVTLSQREPLEFVGLGNYQRVLFEDPQVWQSLSVTLRFAILLVRHAARLRTSRKHSDGNCSRPNYRILRQAGHADARACPNRLRWRADGRDQP